MLLLVERTIDLGKDGAKWKHGYIPLNAAALALKDHKAVGHVGSVRTPKTALTLKKPRVATNTKLSQKYLTNGSPTAADKKILLANAVKMHGADRSKWSTVNLRSAAKHGDTKAATELGKRHPRSPLAKKAATKKAPLKLAKVPMTKIDPDVQKSKDEHDAEAAKIARARAVAKQRKLGVGKSRKSAGEKHVDAEVARQLKLAKPKPEESPDTATPKSIKKSDKPLYALTNKQLQDEIVKANVRGDKEHVGTLKVELAQRKAKISELFGQAKQAKEYINEELPKLGETPSDKQMGKFMRGLVKIMPSLKPKLDKIRNSKATKKIKDVKYFEAIVDSVFETISDHIIGGVLSGAFSAVGLTFLNKGGG